MHRLEGNGGCAVKSPDEPKLAFVESFAAPEGFRSGEGVDDEIVVRELVQNALDAGATEIEFKISEVPITEVPDIEGYRDAVAAIHPDLRRTSVAIAALEKIEAALARETVTCLICGDNGEGLGLAEYQRLLAEAMSSKVGDASEGKLGSVGVGHLTALDASDMRYVLYSSSRSNGTGAVFGGQTILATQLHQKNGSETHLVRQGCLTTVEKVDGFRGFKAEPSAPHRAPAWISAPQHGTKVAVLAYGSRSEHDEPDPDDSTLGADPYMDRIFDAVAKHFMVALKNGMLNITFNSERVHHAVLDGPDVALRLKEKRLHLRAKRGRRALGSGQRAYSAWLTLTEGHMLPFEGGSLWYRLTPGETTSVTVFRNGMRITGQAPYLSSGYFAGHHTFSAVLDADGALAAAIKDCETDSHLEIKIKQAPRSSGKRAAQGLQAVQDTLKEAVGELNTKEWLPEALRIFNLEDTETNIRPSPPKPSPTDDKQLPLPNPGLEPGPDPGPEPGPGPAPDPAPPKGEKERLWKPGSVKGIRRTFAPSADNHAVVGWDFVEADRKPRNVGIAIVVGSGSQPGDRKPEPDQALWIRESGDKQGDWVQELTVPADAETVLVEVRDVPADWEAVTASISRRS